MVWLIKPRVSCDLGKHFRPGLYPRPSFLTFSIWPNALGLYHATVCSFYYRKPNTVFVWIKYCIKKTITYLKNYLLLICFFSLNPELWIHQVTISSSRRLISFINNKLSIHSFIHSFIMKSVKWVRCCDEKWILRGVQSTIPAFGVLIIWLRRIKLF